MFGDKRYRRSYIIPCKIDKKLRAHLYKIGNW